MMRTLHQIAPVIPNLIWISTWGPEMPDGIGHYPPLYPCVRDHGTGVTDDDYLLETSEDHHGCVRPAFGLGREEYGARRPRVYYCTCRNCGYDNTGDYEIRHYFVSQNAGTTCPDCLEENHPTPPRGRMRP